MHKLIGALFIIIGVVFIYSTVLIEYTKNFNDNIVEVECVCKELIECDEDSYNSLWDYTYDNKEQTYRTKTSTNFGLPKVGEESKIGIDDETQKVVYVKKSVKNKIEHTIFGMVFTLSGVAALILFKGEETSRRRG